MITRAETPRASDGGGSPWRAFKTVRITRRREAVRQRCAQFGAVLDKAAGRGEWLDGDAMGAAAMIGGRRFVHGTVLLLTLCVGSLIGSQGGGLVQVTKRGKRHERDAKRHDPASYGDGQFVAQVRITLEGRACVLRQVSPDEP